MSDPYVRILVLDKRKVGQKMTTLNEMINKLDNVIANGYSAWGHVPQYYNDYNVKGNDPTCKHESWTDVQGIATKQPYFNRYCDKCGYRKLFVMYAKNVKKGRK